MHGPPKLDLSPSVWSRHPGPGRAGTLLATAAWQFGSARVGSASAGVFINIEPLMGACVGVLLFGDRLTWALAAGGLMIIAGSFAVVLGERRTPAVCARRRADLDPLERLAQSSAFRHAAAMAIGPKATAAAE
jgi:hypothetical protein